MAPKLQIQSFRSLAWSARSTPLFSDCPMSSTHLLQCVHGIYLMTFLTNVPDSFVLTNYFHVMSYHIISYILPRNNSSTGSQGLGHPVYTYSYYWGLFTNADSKGDRDIREPLGPTIGHVVRTKDVNTGRARTAADVDIDG